MGDDEIGRLDQSLFPGDVDHLAGHHGVIDAGQPRDVSRNGGTRLPQTTVDARCIAHIPGLIETEGDDTDLDDFVLAGVEGCGLRDAPQWKAGPWRIRDGTSSSFRRTR